MKEFDYSWDDQDPEQISDLVEGEYDTSLDSIEKDGISNEKDEHYDDSGLCSCGDGGKQRECEDCKHDMECRESHCENEEHQRVVDFGYPESCNCSGYKSEKICLGCGHTTACNSEQQELCFTEPHTTLLVFHLYPEDCDCQNSDADQKCPDCDHVQGCAEALTLCRASKFHFQGNDGAIRYLKNSNSNVNIHDHLVTSSAGDFSRQGAYWTREEDEQLIYSYLASASEQQIALNLGRSVGAIRGRLIKVCFEANGVHITSLGSEPERGGQDWTLEDDNQLCRLHASGLQLEEIAQILDRTQLSIAYRQVALKLATPGDLGNLNYRNPKT